MITAINSEVDYKAALAEIERLIDGNARAGTTDGDRLNLISLLVEDYEQKRVEIEAPDPIDAIKFRMEQMNLTPRALIPLLGSRSKVSEVLSRKRPLTLSMARALHKGLRVPAKALLQEQFLFNLGEEGVEWERFPIREMVARGWIKGKVNDVRRDAKDVMHKFFAPLGKDWAPIALYKQSDYHLRSARQMDSYALTAWKARVCMRALGSTPSGEFQASALTLDFMHELAHLSTLNDGPRHAVEYLNKVGVSVVVEPHLPETYIDGAAILAGPNRPVVGLTLRYDRIDNFWFVLMHELIHIAKHLNPTLTAFYDDLDVEDGNDVQEREADSLAGEALIPDAEWKKSPASSLRNPDAVEHLASRLRIHPAIIAGRIRHQSKSYRVLNRLVGQGQVRRLFAESVEA
jgi:HTH-type transcriptional regulator / antitoxin HigA